ncbi:MAG: hypothetical protein JWM76_3483 [Pseudonocardiales bacterium]|nr:hypothetical protein [Pseudonocardiales bacterium]
MFNFISKILFRVLSLIIAIPIGRLVSKLVEKAWVAARPGDPPKDPKKADTGWGDAITWAAISGIGIALRKLLTTKGAAGAWKAVIGTPPPGYETDPKKQQLA